MTIRQPRYSKEEFARRGNDIYEKQVRSQSGVGIKKQNSYSGQD